MMKRVRIQFVPLEGKRIRFNDENNTIILNEGIRNAKKSVVNEYGNKRKLV